MGRETNAKANAKELYFVQEIWLGANCAPSQPGYQPVASTSCSVDEEEEELVGGLGGETVDFGGTRPQWGTAMTERGRLKAASSDITNE